MNPVEAGRPTGAATTWRARLGPAHLRRLARLGAGDTLVADLTKDLVGPVDGVADRLAGAEWVADDDPDTIDAELAAAGLVDARGTAEPLAGIVDLWRRATSGCGIDLLTRDPVRAGARTRHRLADGEVVVASSADGRHLELAVLPARCWWMEVTRAALVRLPAAAGSEVTGLPEVLVVPWEPLLAAGRATLDHRPDLVDLVAAPGQGPVLGGTRPGALEHAPPAEAVEWLRVLASAGVGRLHATWHDRDGRTARVGHEEWVLLPDGWRSVEPVVADGWRAVRLTRRRPVELASRLGRLATGGAPVRSLA